MNDKSLVSNAADEEQVSNAKNVVADREKQRDSDLISIMETSAGRRWVWSHLIECHIFADIPIGDHATMAGLIRERSVGLRTLSRIERVCPELYDTMREEQRNAAR